MREKKSSLFKLLKNNFFVLKSLNYKDIIDMVKFISENTNEVIKKEKMKEWSIRKGVIICKPLGNNLFFFRFVFKKRTQKTNNLIHDFYQLMYFFFIKVYIKKIQVANKLELIIKIENSNTDYSDIIKELKSIFRKQEKEEKVNE